MAFTRGWGSIKWEMEIIQIPLEHTTNPVLFSGYYLPFSSMESIPTFSFFASFLSLMIMVVCVSRAPKR